MGSLMYVLEVRNVHEALPLGIQLLREFGIRRDSRNGPVLVMPVPVTTVYKRPWERVIFWPERDANPFLHLYEALWMLAGRNDVAPLIRYSKQMKEYSDDGLTLHGAYGHRWRQAFGRDQLQDIAMMLYKDPNDRRAVLQMWDCRLDLNRQGKDVPCNDTATFQINSEGKLELTIFCRSNDIIWGAYGANAVHFSMLQEYMASWIGVDIGPYRQISVNYHAYINVLDKLHINRRVGTHNYKFVEPTPIIRATDNDNEIKELLSYIDGNSIHSFNGYPGYLDTYRRVLQAHQLWKMHLPPDRFKLPLEVLSGGNQSADWIVAAREWIDRRSAKWVASGEDTQQSAIL